MINMNVIVNDGKSEIPADAGISYIVGKSGLYLRKNIGLVNSLTKLTTHNIPFLLDIEEFAEINLPVKIESIEFEKVVKFFHKVFHIHRSEAMVLIFLKDDGSQIIFDAPEQEVSAATIDYKPMSIEGYQTVGTIHSHGSMSAFHSGTDISDEADFDGIHITLGSFNSNNSNRFSLSAEVAVNGFRQKIDIGDYVKDIEQFTEKVKTKKEKRTGSIFPFGFDNNPFMRFYTNNSYFKNIFQKNMLEKQEHTIINESTFYRMKKEMLDKEWVDENWLKKVKKKVYSSYPTLYNTDRVVGFSSVGNISRPNNIKKKDDAIQNPVTYTEVFDTIHWDNYDDDYESYLGIQDQQDMSENGKMSSVDDFENFQDIVDLFGDIEIPCGKCKYADQLLEIVKQVAEYAAEEVFDSLEMANIDQNILDDPTDCIVGYDNRIIENAKEKK